MIAFPSRTFHQWLRRQGTAISWTAIGAGAVVTVVLGMIGFDKNAAVQEPAVHYAPSTLLYLACQLFLVNSGGVPGPVSWELDFARFCGGLVMASTLIKLLATLFHDKWRDLRLRLYHGHAVVCGLDRRGRKLAEGFLLGDDGKRRPAKGQSSREHRIGQERLPVVIVEWDPDNEHLKPMVELGAEVILADAADEQTLRKARVHRAKCLVAVTVNDDTNIRIATIARRLAGELRKDDEPLECRIHIIDPRLLGLLVREEAGKQAQCEIRAFNAFVNSARRLLFEQDLLDPSRIGPDDSRTAHLVIIGLGRMGEALLVEVARTAQFANLRKPRVTIIDLDARRKWNYLLSRYPHLPLCCNVANVNVCQGDAHDPAIRERLEQWARDDAQLLGVAICLDDDRQAMGLRHAPAAGLRPAGSAGLRSSFRAARLRKPAQGAVRRADAAHPVLRAPEEACTPERVFRPGIEELAEIIHNAYLKEEREKTPAPPPGPTLKPWEELSEHYKNSNREQAEHILWKLRAIGCRRVRTKDPRAEQVTKLTKDEVEVLARMEHLRWCAEKWLDGWQKGPVKDERERTHPNLVPWEELSEEDRDKDRRPVGRVCGLIETSGYLIERDGGLPPGGELFT